MRAMTLIMRPLWLNAFSDGKRVGQKRSLSNPINLPCYGMDVERELDALARARIDCGIPLSDRYLGECLLPILDRHEKSHLYIGNGKCVYSVH